MKRFYKMVSVREDAHGYIIELDGRPVKTPLKSPLIAPNEDLANALVREWSAQEEEIIPDTMPLTQLLSTKIDKVQNDRASLEAPLLKYLDTDLICYFTDHPPELKQAQEVAWTPYLQWFEKRFAAALKTTTDLAALTHDPKAHAAVKHAVSDLSDDHFTILQLATPLSGSLVLALAFIEGELDAKDLFAAMRIEETHKAKIYNEDFYGADPMEEAKDKAIQKDLNAAQEYLGCLSS